MKLKKEKKKARVEILPLMDVIFLLLVFFIYSMVFMSVHQGMPVNLPISTTAAPENSAPVALTIQADSSIFIDKDPVQLEVLTDMLVARAEQEKLKNPDKEPSIQIFADDMLTYGELFKVLDAVKLAKIRKISLQAKPK